MSAVSEHDGGPDTTVLRADLPAGGIEVLHSAVGHLAQIRQIDVDDGLDAWREHAEIALAGERVAIRPPWVPIDPAALAPDAVVVAIDPGRAWGHGAHPTTRLCLAEVERACRDRVGMAVLDLGCGSGALGISAALLGAASVFACDIDPEAVGATEANALRNGVADRVSAHRVVADEPLAEAPLHNDLVVANIGAGTLGALAADILRHTTPDGTLVLSGLLDPVDATVTAAFAPWHVVRTEVLDGWVALVLRSEQVRTPRIVGGR